MPATATLWANARLALCDAAMGELAQGALVTRGERIVWVGPARELPASLAAEVAERFDLEGRWVSPGLIDCHTHLVFAGTRAAESAERLRGVSYESIARRGGGILSTVRATRAATEQELLEQSAPRLEALLAEGITTVEVKSGYGLTLDAEAKMLRVARELGRRYPVRICCTLLAAHMVPPEYAGRADAYLDEVADVWLPALHAEGLVDAVDIFCEAIAFDVAQAERLFAAAARLGLPVKMHAEQLSNLGGSLLAARHRALSCDHLEFAGEVEARALAQSGTVAVLLPIAYYCLGGGPTPPLDALRAAGAAVAVSTDCNPGSAPGASLLLALNMATRLFGLQPQEALAGVTRHAARALGLQGEVGTLAPGQYADFAVWDVESAEELCYWVGLNRCRAVIQAGRLSREMRPLRCARASGGGSGGGEGGR
ncbi:MAG TPA: imidazolonepropionase [Steroidobacteraceae bacterium]|nr:imidazolonepropionase [Steroidobacteraceae bacterium]